MRRLKKQWEQIPNKSAIEAIALSLFQHSATLGNELNKFGIWTYFTNSRAIPGRYFEEASNYPLITPTASVSFTPPFRSYNMTIGPTANYFLRINLPSTNGVFYTIITNSDWQSAIENSDQTFPFIYYVFSDTVSGKRTISDKYSVSFNRDNHTFWNNAGILNNIVVFGDSNYSTPNFERDTYAFPMPFRLSSPEYIKIDFQSDLNTNEEVDLNIYSTGLGLYYSGKKIIQLSYLKDSKKYGRIFLDKSDVDFSSGVYVYIIRSGEDIYKGKLVIFND